MAWNEPGKPSQDPWGDRQRNGSNNGSRNESDPAEELKKKMEAFLSKLNGGGQGNNQSDQTDQNGTPPSMTNQSLGLLASAIGAIWLASGFYIVDPAERGVETVFGAYSNETGAGPHWNWPSPIGQVNTVNVEEIRNAELGYRSVKNGQSDVMGESLMLTQDENIIDVKLAIQYSISNAAHYVFNHVEPDAALKEITESALREVVGKNKMDFVLTEGRSQVVAKVKELVQATCDAYKIGIQVSSVNLQDAQPPEQVQAAFADVVKAREDRQRLINEAEAYSNDIIPRARGQAARLVEEATAYRDQVTAKSEGESNRFTNILTQYKLAPEVTRQRMYLEAIETVLGSSSKIMVSNKNSNQMLYLPLDKWMTEESSGTRRSPTQTIQASDTVPSSTASPAVPSPSLRDNLRSREVR